MEGQGEPLPPSTVDVDSRDSVGTPLGSLRGEAVTAQSVRPLMNEHNHRLTEQALQDEIQAFEADQKAKTILLQRSEKALEKRRKALDEREQCIEEKDAELLEREEGLDEREVGLDAKEHELQMKEEELNQRINAVYAMLRRRQSEEEGETDLKKCWVPGTQTKKKHAREGLSGQTVNREEDSTGRAVASIQPHQSLTTDDRRKENKRIFPPLPNFLKYWTNQEGSDEHPFQPAPFESFDDKSHEETRRSELDISTHNGKGDVRLGESLPLATDQILPKPTSASGFSKPAGVKSKTWPVQSEGGAQVFVIPSNRALSTLCCTAAEGLAAKLTAGRYELHVKDVEDFKPSDVILVPYLKATESSKERREIKKITEGSTAGNVIFIELNWKQPSKFQPGVDKWELIDAANTVRVYCKPSGELLLSDNADDICRQMTSLIENKGVQFADHHFEILEPFEGIASY